MSFELSGKLFEKFDEVQVSDSFKKREFVVETSENNFTEHVKFQLLQDRCGLIDGIEVNEEVTVSFNIKGRRWEKDGKVNYFTNLDAWRIEKKSEGPDAPPPFTDEDVPFIPEDEDDLPF